MYITKYILCDYAMKEPPKTIFIKAIYSMRARNLVFRSYRGSRSYNSGQFIRCRFHRYPIPIFLEPETRSCGEKKKKCH